MSTKKNKSRKQPKVSPKKTKKVAAFKIPDFLTNDRTFLIASIALVAIYYAFSFSSTGFHQHDGAAHFLKMRGAWQDPLGIFATHKSIGFYLLYGIPAKIGLGATKVWGAIIAAATCFLTYKVTKHYNKNIAFLAFIFLATQHWWVNFTFRTHVEVATAFVFILAAFLHQKEKYLWSGFVFGFLGAMRPELYIIGFGYFLYLAFIKKHYIAALAVGISPLFFNIAGFLSTGKPLFVIDSLLGGPGAGTWKKAGFDHYFNFFSEVYGGLSVTLLATFLGAWLLSKKKNEQYWIIFLPAAAYVLMQCIFNLQAIPIGPYTGGTVRYIICVGPFIAVMAALGVAAVEQMESKWKILFFLIPLLLVTGTLLSYYMASSMKTNVRDWHSTATIAISTLLVMLPTTILRKDYKYMAYGLLALASAYITIKPYVIDEELATVKQTAAWYQGQYGLNKNVKFYNNHTLFYYFLEKAKEEIAPLPENIINDEQMKNAPKGSIILWDSHYGYRPNKANYELKYTYFTERPNEYKLIQQFPSPNQRFLYLAFEKL